jgi:GT2 family glycosyltransferase
VVGPRLVDGTGHAELSFGPMMGPFAELRQKFIQRAGTIRIERMTSQRRQVDWVSGACLLTRRAEAEAAGLFDERFFMYCEDVDFCAAIRARGGRVYFTPATEIVHLRGRSAASAPKATLAAYRASHLAFYQKHHPAWVPLLRLYLLRGKPPAPTADKQ